MQLPKNIQDAIKLHNQLYDKAIELEAGIADWMEKQGLRELPHHYMRTNEEPVYPISRKRLEDLYNRQPGQAKTQGRTDPARKRKDNKRYAKPHR